MTPDANAKINQCVDIDKVEKLSPRAHLLYGLKGKESVGGGIVSVVWAKAATGTVPAPPAPAARRRTTQPPPGPPSSSRTCSSPSGALSRITRYMQGDVHGGSLVVHAPDFGGGGPGFESSITHNDPGALEDHCVILLHIRVEGRPPPETKIKTYKCPKAQVKPSSSWSGSQTA